MDDKGFENEAKHVQACEDAAFAALCLDREWYSKTYKFRHLVPVKETCDTCIYLVDISDEVGIKARGCVRKGGPIFLDLEICTTFRIGEEEEYTCNKHEWREDE